MDMQKQHALDNFFEFTDGPPTPFLRRRHAVGNKTFDAT